MLGRGEFAKYHALGNDYLVVDATRLGFRLTPRRVRSLCDRHTGIGSDGILALGRTRAAGVDYALRIYNPDGSEAEKSGNGLRIFARALRDLGYTRRRELVIATPGGRARAELLLRGNAVSRIRVDMGRVSFRSSDLPMRGRARDVVAEPLRVGARRFRVTGLSVGNPHCVCFQKGALDEEELARWGPQIERHASFPRRVNVQWARVRSRRALEAIIWERGAGATRASGSSACAVAAAALRQGLADARVRVHMPGGSLAIEIDADWNVRMTGPATPVFRGRVL